MGGIIGRPLSPKRKKSSKSQRSSRRFPSNSCGWQRHERAVKSARGCNRRSNISASDCSRRGDGDKVSVAENEYDDQLYDLFRTFYLWGSSWEKGDIMASKIKRDKSTSRKRKATKKDSGSGEAWWDRLSRGKRSSSCNATDPFRSFSWWEPQKECGCERDCIHELANSLTTRCVDLQASADRLSKPKNPCPSVLTPDRNLLRSFNWWRACRARDRILPPAYQVAPLLATPRRRPAPSPSPDRCSDSSSTAEKVYRTFCWWQPSNCNGRGGRGRSLSRSRSLSLDVRSRRSGSGDERRERSLSPGERKRSPDSTPGQLFRTFSWWQLPSESCRRSDSSPPAKLRRRVSFNFGEKGIGDAAPGAGDVASGWKRTVVDKCRKEQQTMPAKPVPCRPQPSRCRPTQRGVPPARNAPSGNAGGDKQIHNAFRKVMKSPGKTAEKKTPPVAAKGSKSEGSAGAKKGAGPGSPARPKSPVGPKSPVRARPPVRAARSPERAQSPARTKSEPEAVQPPPETETETESDDSDGAVTDTTVTTETTKSPSPPSTSGRTSPQQDGGGSPGPSSGEESPHPSSERESPRPSSGSGSPRPSSGSGSPRPSSGSGSPRPGSGSGSPRPGSGRGSPRPGSVSRIPRPASGGRVNSRPASGSRVSSPPASGGRVSSRPASGGRVSSRPGSGGRVSSRPASGGVSRGPGWAEVCRAWLSGWRWPNLAAVTPGRPSLPRLNRNTKNVMKAGLLCVLVGYTSVNYWTGNNNYWKDIEELLGFGPEDPCGGPENIYLCI